MLMKLIRGAVFAGSLLAMAGSGSAWAQSSGAGEAVKAVSTTTYTISCHPPDTGKLLSFTNLAAVAVTLPTPGSVACITANSWVDLANGGTGAGSSVVLTPSGATIDGLASLTLYGGQGIRLLTDGTNYYTQRGGSNVYPNNANLITNGDAALDQRNEGNSITLTSAGGNIMVVDRWQGNWTASTSGAGTPVGARETLSSSLFLPAFALKVTGNSTAGTTVPAALHLIVQQQIEGQDVADLQFGSTSPTPTTLSIWLKSSIASATYGIAVQNAAASRSYVYACSVPTAATWTLCSAEIPGDTAGTWNSTVGSIGTIVSVTAACGSTFQGTAGVWSGSNITCTSAQTQMTNTASATLEITAAKWERGNNATPFMDDPAPILLTKATRFYRKTFPIGVVPAQNNGLAGAYCVQSAAAQPVSAEFRFDPKMYAAPTVVTYNPSAAAASWRDVTGSANLTATVDPSTATSGSGLEIISAAAAAAAHDICIQATFDTGY